MRPGIVQGPGNTRRRCQILPGLCPVSLNAVDLLGITAIMAVTDSTTQVLAEKRGQFHASITKGIPSSESYDLVSNKYRLMNLAHELEIPIPKTVFVPDGNIVALRDQVKAYPVVVKPGRSLVKSR